MTHNQKELTLCLHTSLISQHLFTFTPCQINVTFFDCMRFVPVLASISHVPPKTIKSISIDLYVKLQRNIYVGNFVIFPQLCLLRSILMYYFFLKGKHEDIEILCLLAVLSVVML